MRKIRTHHFLTLCLLGIAQFASGQEPQRLDPGQSVERTIAGGESHTYQIDLAAGQFVRVVVEQRGIDVKLLLAGADGKPLIESDLTGIIGAFDSLAYESAGAGTYQLVVRSNEAPTLSGPYEARLEIKASATTQDRKQITAETLLNEARQFTLRNEYKHPELEEKLSRSLRIFQETGDRYTQAITLNLIALTNRRNFQYEKAIETYRMAASIFHEVNNHSLEGMALNNLGIAYALWGRQEKAIEYWEGSMAAYRESNDPNIDPLGNMCIAYHELGQYEMALDCNAKVLDIRRDRKERDGEATVLMALGNIYSQLGRQEKAIEYFEQALRIAREIKERETEGYALGNLGTAYDRLEQYEKATEYYELTLAIARELKDRSAEGKTLNNLGGLYIRRTIGGVRANHLKAIEYAEQALNIARLVKDPHSEVMALNNLALAHRNLRNFEKANEYFEQAMAILRENKDPVGLAGLLYDWAISAEKQGDLSAAGVHIEESLKIVEGFRDNEIVSPESRASFLATMQNTYNVYTQVLMRQHRAEPTKGFDALALAVSERQRARSLLDLLAESGTEMNDAVDPKLVERERTLAKQLSDKAQIRPGSPEQAAALKLEISQIETDLERAQVAIRTANPNYAALTRPQPLTLAEIQAQLDADTVLLEYSQGYEQSYVFVVTKDALTTYELPKPEVIEKSAREVYELLTARSTTKADETAIQRQERINQAEAKLPNAAKELSQMILAPVAAQLGSKRLMIVAHGALQYIPFAMLPDPATGGTQPLIVGHEVVSLPSASTLVFQRAALAGRQPAPKTLAVIADPVFARTDPRFKTAVPLDDKAPASSIKPADMRGLEHITDASDGKSGSLVIRRLPFTRQEADALVALTPKNATFKAIDFQANRTNVLNGDLSQYRYVHFATHGVMDAERPGLSSLVLSTVDAAGRPQNGFLRANDIYNMKLPAELVVLSACQTGLGKEVKGEGLIGLTRGFMYAGAKRVVVSLWSVNDKATSDLMTKFYRGMLKDNERPAAALRTAQIEMWKQKKWRSPYYWAAFTMQGEWR